MTLATNAQTTYDTTGRREDLSDVIYNVDPIDAPFLASIPTSDATGIKHEWQTDSFAAASTSNAHLEGDDATTDAVDATTRLFNYTQISDKIPRVTGTQRAVRSAGREDELEYQVFKRSMELRRDMEANLIGAHVAQVAGNNTTIRKYGTVGTWLTSNLSEAGDATTSTGIGANARTDGTNRALTEDMLKEVFRECFSNGGNPDCIITGAFNKQAISGFTGNATRVKTAEDRTLQAAIDIYESDFGDMQVIPDRFCRPVLGGADTTGDLFVLQKDMWAVSYLRTVGVEPLSKNGDSDRRQILVEYTLESRNEKASGAVYDLSIS